MKIPISSLMEVHFIITPAEAVCVVQCLRLTIEMLHQTAADYGASGVVDIPALREKLAMQVEQQRECARPVDQ